jgi:hypothetical protein
MILISLANTPSGFFFPFTILRGVYTAPIAVADAGCVFCSGTMRQSLTLFRIWWSDINLSIFFFVFSLPGASGRIRTLYLRITSRVFDHCSVFTRSHIQWNNCTLVLVIFCLFSKVFELQESTRFNAPVQSAWVHIGGCFYVLDVVFD